MGCDIDFTSGEVSHRRVDVDLPGVMPVEFTRRYSSHLVEQSGVLGAGWTHSLDVWAITADAGVTIHDGLNTPRLLPWGECDGVKGPRVDPIPDGLRLLFPDLSEWVFTRTGMTAGGRADLSSRRDRWGNTLTRHYDGGRLVRIVDADGRILRLDYGRGDFLSQISIAHRDYQPEPVMLARFETDRNGDLVAALDQAGFAEAYVYVNHLMIGCRNKNGGIVHYAYDDDRRCRRSWRDDGSLNHRFDYDVKGKRSVLSDSYGHRMVQMLNDRGLVGRQIDSIGNAREVAYDPAGRFIAITDDLGTVGQTESYDPITRRLWNANGAGEQSVTQFDERGRVVRRFNEAPWSLSYTYNAAGQVESITSGQGYGITFEYDESGRTRRVIGSDGYVVRLEFEHNGLHQKVLDADGLIEELLFDVTGNLVTHRDSRGVIRHFEYAGQDIFVSETLADGRRTTYRHDAEGNATAVVDPAGNARHFAIDAFGKVIGETDPLGQTVRYEYDLEDRLQAVVNKKGDRFELEHDATGNEIACRFFEGDVQRAEYDVRGRRTRITHPDGGVTTVEYDGEDRIVRVVRSDGTVHALSRDAVGRVTSIASERPRPGGAETSEMLIAYDANDFVTREEHDERWIEHDYDPLRHPMAVRDSWGTETVYRRGARYRLESVEEDGRLFSVRWNAAGYLQALAYPNGMTQVCDVDRYGRLLQRDVLGADGRLLARRTFQYDPADRLIASTDTRDGTVRYAYDRAGRLTSVSDENGAVAESYAYDANDNLAAAHWGGAAVSVGDQVVRSGDSTFEYDARGRMIRRLRGGDRWTFEWDGDDQLTRVLRNDVFVASYSYDQLGRRLQKITAEGTTEFMYDEFANLRAERHGDLTIRYVYLPNFDAPIACHVGPDWFFYTFDQLGMPTEVWNEQGALVCRLRKEAYGTGRQLADVAGTAPPLPFLFPGQYLRSGDWPLLQHVSLLQPVDRELHQP